MTFWRLLIILSLAGVGYYFFQDTKEVKSIKNTVFSIINYNQIKYRNGILVNSVPAQKPIRERSFKIGKNTLQPVAVFGARGRVLSKEKYWFDREANLAPYDIVLGWRQMSDQQVVEKSSFRQGLRFYDYDFDIQGMPVRIISHNTANIHMIPADERIARTIERIEEGDIIFLSGKLVNVSGKDGWRWKTSLIRTDLGDGSSEILYVQNLSIITDKYPRVK